MANDIIGNTVENVMSFNFAKSAGFAKFMFFAKIILMIAALLFLCLLFYKFVLQYKIKIRVLRMSGGSIIDMVDDKAKMVRTDAQGKRKFVLFKLRKTLPPPATKYKYKTGKKDTYFLYEDDNGELHPCDLGEINPDQKMLIKAVPEERKGWARMEEMLAEDKIRKQNWFEKHKEFVALVMACACAFLIMFFAAQAVNDGMNSVAQQFGQIATNCAR